MADRLQFSPTWIGRVTGLLVSFSFSLSVIAQDSPADKPAGSQTLAEAPQPDALTELIKSVREMISQGRYPAAVDALTQALSKSDSEIPLLTLRAEAFAKAGRYQAAIDDLNKAILSEPENADHLNSRGFVKMSSGDLDGAEVDFSTALEINPKLAKSYNNRGMIKVAQQDYLMAVNDFNEAL